MSNERLAGRHVVVTGAANGIGRGIAVCAAKDGANVSIFDVDESSAAKTTELIEAEGVQALVCDVDVSDRADVQAGIERATEVRGPIDGLVNNAGIQDVVPILETSEDQWDRYMAVNAKGTFLCSKLVAEHMTEEEIAGSIVNIASMSAVDPSPGQGAYGASKGAVAAFTVVLAKELREHGINANAINPGGVETPMYRKWLKQHSDEDDPDVDDQIAATKADDGIRRLGQPADIGNMTTFLLSDEAEWISGEAYQIKGAHV